MRHNLSPYARQIVLSPSSLLQEKRGEGKRWQNMINLWHYSYHICRVMLIPLNKDIRIVIDFNKQRIKSKICVVVKSQEIRIIEKDSLNDNPIFILLNTMYTVKTALI